MVLTVRSKVDGKVLLVLVEDDGVVTIQDAFAEIRQAADGWIARGLREYVGPRGERRPRHTLASDPDFLPRLAAYMKDHFACDVTLDSRGGASFS